VEAPAPTTAPAYTAVVVAGGDPIGAATAALLPHDALVIAADSGVEHAQSLGLRIGLIVGDLDSADPAAVDAAVADGAAVERHPAAKDATDLELALRAARDRGVTRIVVVGGYGGRLDHFLGNALVLAGADLVGVAVEWLVDGARLTVVRDRATLEGKPGDLCSLLAVGGPAVGVTTRGFRFPLAGEDLLPGSTRGVSNELLEPTAEVTLGGGVLLAVQPKNGGKQ